MSKSYSENQAVIRTCGHGFLFTEECKFCTEIVKINNEIKDFYREQHQKNQDMFHAGLKSGIAFVTEKFYGHLPIGMQVKFLDEAIEHFYKEYNSL